MGLAETAKLAVQLSLKDGLTPGLRTAGKSVSTFDKSVRRTSKGINQVGGSLLKIGAVAGTAAAVGIYAAAKAGASFEAQLNTINTIARESESGLAGIGDGLRQLARDGRGSLDDLSAGYYDLLSAGIKVGDAQKVLESATTLAIGGLSTNAEAVDLLTTAINSYGQSASDAQKDADLFAKAIEIGKVKASEISATFASIAPIAAQTGINIEEVAAAYGALTAQGTAPSEVATQMQRAILDLLNPNKKLLAIQKKLGVNFMKMAKDKGLVVALQAMRDAVNGDEAAFKDLFGRVEGYKFALQTTGPQQQKYNDALAAMGSSAGTASEQMGERTKGLAFQVNRLKANLNDAAIEISAGFLPALARAADKISTWLSMPDNRKQLRSLGEDIGKAIDSIDWDKVLRAAQGVASALKPALSLVMQLADLIAKLPPELVGGAATLIVANKVTGGGLAAGAGNIIGGLGETLARSLASKIPLFGPAFVQPVFVTNMGVGGVGGAAGAAGKGAGVMGAISKVFLVGAAVGVAAELWDIKQQQTAANNAQGTALRAQASGFASTASTPELANALKGVREEQKRLRESLTPEAIAYQLNIDGVRDNIKDVESKLDRQLTASYDTRTEAIAQRQAVLGVKAKQAEAVVAFRAAERTFASIPAPKVSVSTNVRVNVSASDVRKSVTTHARYGERAPSRNGGAARVAS